MGLSSSVLPRTVVTGNDCAAQPQALKLMHWVDSGDVLLPVFHKPTLEVLRTISGQIGILSGIGTGRESTSRIRDASFKCECL